MIMRNINISSCTAARKTSVIFLNKKIPAQFVFQKKRAKRRILNIHTIGRSIGLKSSQIFAIYLQDFPILKRDRNPRRFYHLIEKIGLSLFIPPSLPPHQWKKNATKNRIRAMKIPYSKFKQLPVHVCAVWNRYAYKWGIFIFLLCFDPLFCRICIRGVQEYKGGSKFYVLFLRNRFTTVIQNIHSILRAAKILEFYFLLLCSFLCLLPLKIDETRQFLLSRYHIVKV